MQCKVDAICTYSGEGCVTKCAPSMEAREVECARIQAATGATFIPPYDHEWIISGQVGALASRLAAGGQPLSTG